MSRGRLGLLGARPNAYERIGGTGELAGRLKAWIGRLADRSRPLAEIDDELIRALDASQADSGLVPHITACSGEPRHG